jgi:N,N'-diacetyllegionaminate synthase
MAVPDEASSSEGSSTASPLDALRQSDRQDQVFIIAEIGKNFIQTEDDRPVGEYIENAVALIDAAADAGVDAVKFQTHVLEDEQLPIDVVSPHFKGADRYSWVSRNASATPDEFWTHVKNHAAGRGVTFFSTPMSRKAAEKLQALDVELWKVGSGDVQDYLLLDYLVETGKPIILSTGMVSLAELDELVQYLRSRQADFSLLYCVSQYPAPKGSFNLATIEHLKSLYPGVIIGFSDHSVGDLELTLAAVKTGARIIEKHFSLSRELWGSDHKVSMTPAEMKDLVTAIRSGAYRDVDSRPYLGTPDRELEGACNQFRPYFNKALVAGQDIPADTTLTKDLLYAMRPLKFAGGLPASELPRVIGRRTRRPLTKYEPITESLF